MIDPNSIQIEKCSDLTQAEVAQLIGKTIIAIHAGEFAVEITFSDGTVLEAQSGFEGSVSVSVDWPDKSTPERVPSRMQLELIQMRNAQQMQELASIINPPQPRSLAYDMYLRDLLK